VKCVSCGCDNREGAKVCGECATAPCRGLTRRNGIAPARSYSAETAQVRFLPRATALLPNPSRITKNHEHLGSLRILVRRRSWLLLVALGRFGKRIRNPQVAAPNSVDACLNAGRHSLARFTDRAFRRYLFATLGLRRNGPIQDCPRNSRHWVIISESEGSNSGFSSETSQTSLGLIPDQSTHGNETTVNPYFTGFQEFRPFLDTIWNLRRLTLRSDSGSLPNAEDWGSRRRHWPSAFGSMRRL
jgi:hypothetical protein